MEMSDNFYDEHPLMLDSGTFWRCKHGNTGIKPGTGNQPPKFIGCRECKAEKEAEDDIPRTGGERQGPG